MCVCVVLKLQCHYNIIGTCFFCVFVGFCVCLGWRWCFYVFVVALVFRVAYIHF